MNNIKSFLKRYRLLRNLTQAKRDVIKILKSETYRLWKSSTRTRSIQSYLRAHKIRKLHLGAGSNVLEGWLNTDLSPQSNEIVYLDITEPLPFQDRTFDYVFSEHLIEHVSYMEASKHLKECYRVLKPGGKIRIATPNLRFLIDLYTSKEKTAVQHRYIQKIVDGAFPDTGFYHETFVINFFLQGWGHQFIYDVATLEDALNKAGFQNINRYAVKESMDPHLQDLEHHGTAISENYNLLETMVVEGTRIDQ